MRCGYTVYLDLVRPYFPDKLYYSTGMTKEIDRCRWALEKARTGKRVALVCSGVIGLGVGESREDDELRQARQAASNYKYATAMDNDKIGKATYPADGKSYYLSAGSADELSNIFQQISQEVGGSTSNLDDKATIKDIVTPYFNMPTDVKDVEVSTA